MCHVRARTRLNDTNPERPRSLFASLYQLLIAGLIDFGQGQKRSYHQRAVDNAQNSKQLEPANDGKKYNQGMHPHTLTDQFRFKEIFNATRKDDIKHQEKYTGTNAPLQKQ